MKRPLLLRVLLALGVLTVLACGGGTNLFSTNPQVRAFNAASDSTAMNFRVDDLGVGFAVPPGSGSPAYIEVEPGERDIEAVEVGFPESQALAVATLLNETDYVLLSFGLVNPLPGETQKRLDVALVPVDRDAPSDTQSRLYVLNAYNSAPTEPSNPAIDFQNPGDLPSVKVANIDFGQTRSTLLDAGVQTSVARFAGEAGELTPPLTYTFAGGRTYLAMVMGIGDSGSITIIQL